MPACRSDQKIIRPVHPADQLPGIIPRTAEQDLMRIDLVRFPQVLHRHTDAAFTGKSCNKAFCIGCHFCIIPVIHDHKAAFPAVKHAQIGGSGASVRIPTVQIRRNGNGR